MTSSIKKAGLATLTMAAVAMCSAQQISVVVDGKNVNFPDTGPRMVNGRVLVPLRGVFEEMGATVNWNPSTRTVIANRGASDVQLRIGDRNAMIGGQNVALDVPAMIIGSSTMVPIRFVSEALGADVNWMSAMNRVTINTSAVNNNNTTINTPPANMRRVMVSENTVIPVTLDHTLSTIGTAKGDKFVATVNTSGMDEYNSIPKGTKVEGHVAAVHPMKNGQPALLDLAFDRLRFPNGRSVKIDGQLISLDADHVTRDANGTLVVNQNSSNKDQRLVYAGYGAGAGLIVGLLTKRPLEGTILGGALGYILGQVQKDKGNAQNPSDITLRPGTQMGVRLNQDVTVSWPADGNR